MVKLKNKAEISGIYRSGQITGKFLDEVANEIKPGVTTAALNSFAKEFIAKHGGSATFFNYKGFPGHICTSLNNEIVHGIPGARQLVEGDLLSIDVGVTLDGFVSDSARTYVVGDSELASDAQRLMQHTKQSLFAGIEAFAHNIPLRLVSRAIEQVLRAGKLGIVRDLTGHGVGFELHEEPTVYNFDPGNRWPLLENGMVLALEPMATLGSEAILLGADGWTYTTTDGSLAAHFEHTIACWDGRPFVLTDPADDGARQAFGSRG